MEKVLNTVSGRYLKKGGRTYGRLIRLGYELKGEELVPPNDKGNKIDIVLKELMKKEKNVIFVIAGEGDMITTKLLGRIKQFGPVRLIKRKSYLPNDLFISEDVKNRLSKEYKEISIRNINTAIKRIYIKALKEKHFIPRFLRTKQSIIIDYIKKQKITSQKQLMSSIRSVMGSDPYDNSDYSTYFEELVTKFDDEYKYKDEVLKSFQRLEDIYLREEREDLTDQEKLIRKIYLSMPPVRQQELYSIQIDDGVNYIDTEGTEGMRIVIRDHKTKHIRGQRVIELSKDIGNSIREFIGKNRKKGQYLFLNKRGLPYYNTWGPLMKKVIGIGNNLLRKIYIIEVAHFARTHMKDQYGKVIKEMAKRMGHRPETQQAVYNSFEVLNKKWSSKEFMESIISQII